MVRDVDDGDALTRSVLHRAPASARIDLLHAHHKPRAHGLCSSCSKVLGWVRTQSGTTRLSATHMDEISLLPPREPAEQEAVITLLKRRAVWTRSAAATRTGGPRTRTRQRGTVHRALQTEREKGARPRGSKGGGRSLGSSTRRDGEPLSGLGNRVSDEQSRGRTRSFLKTRRVMSTCAARYAAQIKRSWTTESPTPSRERRTAPQAPLKRTVFATARIPPSRPAPGRPAVFLPVRRRTAGRILHYPAAS